MKDYLICIVPKLILNALKMSINATEDLVYISLWCATGIWTVISLGMMKTNAVRSRNVFIELNCRMSNDSEFQLLYVRA